MSGYFISFFYDFLYFQIFSPVIQGGAFLKAPMTLRLACDRAFNKMPHPVYSNILSSLSDAGHLLKLFIMIFIAPF